MHFAKPVFTTSLLSESMPQMLKIYGFPLIVPYIFVKTILSCLISCLLKNCSKNCPTTFPNASNSKIWPTKWYRTKSILDIPKMKNCLPNEVQKKNFLLFEAPGPSHHKRISAQDRPKAAPGFHLARFLEPVGRLFRGLKPLQWPPRTLFLLLFRLQGFLQSSSRHKVEPRHLLGLI